MMKSWHVPVVVLGGLSLFACGDVGADPNLGDPLCSATTFDIPSGRVATFGTSADARKVEDFLRATAELSNGVRTLNETLLATCRSIGTDLGLTAADYTPMSANELPVATVCRRVAREVQTQVQQSLPQGARLVLTYTPPVCAVDITVAAACQGRCTGNVMAMVPRCTGEVVADCMGSCTGSCEGTCAADCMGSCNGTCTGSCMGTCVGECTGTCSQRDGAGRCVGTCSGTCQGSCSAQCMGSCQGSCSAGCQGSCTGQCRGSCTVASNVRCDGRYELEGDVQCRAACQAQANARARCTPPALTITTSGTVPAGSAARITTLVTTLQRNYPAILAAQAQLTTVLGVSAPNFAASLDGAGQAARNVGLTAVACFTRAAAASVETASQFSASVTVTVEFSASVSASGSATGG